MSKPGEIREGALEFAADDIRVRAGFRIATDAPLAGGPVELEFSITNLGVKPLKLAVSGDRMRQRPGDFSFTATFNGSTLGDPMAAVANAGGPQGIVEVSANAPWHQTLVLNQFIRLEQTRDLLAPRAMGRLELSCSRPLPLAATDAAALPSDESPLVAVHLAFELRRDDVALAAVAARLYDEVMQGPAAARERPLALLLAMRSAARAQIDALSRHPDPLVSERARNNQP